MITTPEISSLAALSDAEAACTRCPLYRNATQVVPGEGPSHAQIMLVGEQPGDQEDRQGRPFVGPAGQVLNRALQEAGSDRGESYLTNAVKHFEVEQRAPRLIHQKPTPGEVSHYRWWLDKELDFVRPRLVVALGATAVLALAGKALPVMKNRGPHELGGHAGFITVHPSSLLRAPGDEARRKGFAAF